MPTWLKPKGVFSRNSIDWWMARGAWGSGQNNGSGGSTSIQLFNNDTLGRYFWLYGIQANLYASEQLYGQFIQGTLGTEWGGCYPLISDGPTPPGVIYTGDTPAGADLIHIPWTFQGDQPTAPLMMPFPLAIIAPTYGLALYTAFTATAMIVTFWYLYLDARS